MEACCREVLGKSGVEKPREEWCSAVLGKRGVEPFWGRAVLGKSGEEKCWGRGFYAVLGAQGSTSEWCARASTADVVVVQTDQQSSVAGLGGAIYDGGCLSFCSVSSC